MKSEIAGLVLAGGLSSRMGANKALLRLWGENGPTLLERSYRLLAAITPLCLVSCRSGQNYPGFPCLEDAADIGGPAGGILAGLRFCQQEGFAGLLALACDMPNMIEKILLRLLAAHSAENAMITCFRPASGGKLEMLAAVYGVSFLPQLRHGLAGGERSLYGLAQQERVQILTYSQKERKYFLNCNTPADIAAYCGGWE